jgi:hypothetical protein
MGKQAGDDPEMAVATRPPERSNRGCGGLSIV